ncbi:DUF664 domain-containing protein [Bowdeniella massiliensis]|uniref:mycothiol transferase n=1 Tax=Bowdeniella massiliensis TaxID=2932264 RepID=UPI002028791C|nr:DUF664 domain-containing protein [Bowdeniella massiliensis]
MSTDAPSLNSRLQWKTCNLGETGLRQPLPPSAMTLGGLLSHLAYVEDHWFGAVAAKSEPSEPWASTDWEADMDADWNRGKTKPMPSRRLTPVTMAARPIRSLIAPPWPRHHRAVLRRLAAMRKSIAATALACAAALALSACAGQADNPRSLESTTASLPTESATTDVDPDQKFPDVVEAELKPSGDQFSIAVTISSPYDTPERYADGWRVMTEDGEVLAEHDLAHDHANEQPFTRERGPFTIPDDVAKVVVEGRDQANGYGGKTVTIDVPR